MRLLNARLLPAPKLELVILLQPTIHDLSGMRLSEREQVGMQP